MDKTANRKKCFAAIRVLSSTEKQVRSESICRNIEQLSEFRDANCVFSYIGLPSEVSVDSLFANHAEKKWAVSLVEADGTTLTFRYISNFDSELVKGAFGFMEPRVPQCPLADTEALDLILVPGLGFDPSNGTRLGRGKGHYDRFLAPLIKENATQRAHARPHARPLIVGVAFDTQITALRPESHDIPMDLIVTESKVYSPRESL